MNGDYDGIILGAGHNALILATYLGRAGLRVLAVDRAAVAGGGLATLEAPTPFRLPAQHPRLFPAGDHRHAVVRGSRSRTPRRALYRAGAQRRAAHARRPRARMVDGHRTHDRFGRAVQPARCRHAAPLARRVRPDRARHSRSRESLAAAAAGRTPGAAGTHGSRAAGCSR